MRKTEALGIKAAFQTSSEEVACVGDSFLRANVGRQRNANSCCFVPEFALVSFVFVSVLFCCVRFLCLELCFVFSFYLCISLSCFVLLCFSFQIIFFPKGSLPSNSHSSEFSYTHPPPLIFSIFSWFFEIFFLFSTSSSDNSSPKFSLSSPFFFLFCFFQILSFYFLFVLRFWIFLIISILSPPFHVIFIFVISFLPRFLLNLFLIYCLLLILCLFFSSLSS